MKKDINMQMKQLRLLGRKDPGYQQMEAEFVTLEMRLLRMAGDLTKNQQGLLWNYICTSDALDHRLWEIACDQIVWD